MQPDEPITMVRPPEKGAHRNPARFKWSVASLMLLGLFALFWAAPPIFTIPRLLLGVAAALALALVIHRLNQSVPGALSVVKPTDVFLPHDLQRAELQTVLQLLDCECAVCRACLVRKEATTTPQQPVYVLGLDIRKCLFQSGRLADNRKIVENLLKSIHLPGPVHIFVAEGHDKLLGKTVMNVPGGTILNREA